MMPPVRLGERSWTPSQIPASDTTSAFLSHRAAHLSPQVLWNLALWTLPTSW